MKQDTQELMIRIGKNIKYYRELAGLSREELAQKAGYKNRSSIAKIEAGETRVQAFKIIDFARALGVDANDLISDDNKVTIKEPLPESAIKINETNDAFKKSVILLTKLDDEQLQKAYTVLNTMFGG